MFDWMHNFVVGGVFHVEMTQLLKVLGDNGVAHANLPPGFLTINISVFKLLRLELASGMYFLRVLNICIYLTTNVECIYWALLKDDLQAPLLSSMPLAKFPGR